VPWFKNSTTAPPKQVALFKCPSLRTSKLAPLDAFFRPPRPSRALPRTGRPLNCLMVFGKCLSIATLPNGKLLIYKSELGGLAGVAHVGLFPVFNQLGDPHEPGQIFLSTSKAPSTPARLHCGTFRRPSLRSRRPTQPTRLHAQLMTAPRRSSNSRRRAWCEPSEAVSSIPTRERFVERVSELLSVPQRDYHVREMRMVRSGTADQGRRVFPGRDGDGLPLPAVRRIYRRRTVAKDRRESGVKRASSWARLSG